MLLFLESEIQVLSMSRLGAAGAVVPLITDVQNEVSFFSLQVVLIPLVNFHLHLSISTLVSQSSLAWDQAVNQRKWIQDKKSWTLATHFLYFFYFILFCPWDWAYESAYSSHPPFPKCRQMALISLHCVLVQAGFRQSAFSWVWDSRFIWVSRQLRLWARSCEADGIKCYYRNAVPAEQRPLPHACSTRLCNLLSEKRRQHHSPWEEETRGGFHWLQWNSS